MEYLGQDRREGLGRKAHSRFVLILLILVSVLLLLSSLYSAQASVFKKAREGVMDAASPVLTLFSGPVAYVHGVFGSIGDYFSVMEQNKALREENAELRQWMNEALELRETIATYEALQGYLAPPEAQPATLDVAPPAAPEGVPAAPEPVAARVTSLFRSPEPKQSGPARPRSA